MAEPKKPTPDTLAAKATVKALRVIAKRDGFRRSGREFSGTATDIPLSELKKGQREQLESEPMLVCSEVDVAAAE